MIFEIGAPGAGRLGLCTWGAGGVGAVAHRTIIARLADHVTATTTVEQAIDELATLIEREATRQGADAIGEFGYFFGGVDPATRDPSCYHLRFQNGQLRTRAAFRIGQARFQGAPHIFSRIHRGFDPQLPANLLDELQKRIGDSVPNLQQTVAEAFREAAAPLTLGGAPNLPVREAVDFLHMYLHATVKAFKFRFGPPICGGPLEIGFISTDRPFRWTRHKPFDVAILETEAGA